MIASVRTVLMAAERLDDVPGVLTIEASRESGDELELRNATGAIVLIPKAEIDERGKSEQSIMPNGLLDPLTPHDLASLLAYLESLKNK